MSTHMPWFKSFLSFFASFCIGQISHQQPRVNPKSNYNCDICNVTKIGCIFNIGSIFNSRLASCKWWSTRWKPLLNPKSLTWFKIISLCALKGDWFKGFLDAVTKVWIESTTSAVYHVKFAHIERGDRQSAAFDAEFNQYVLILNDKLSCRCAVRY